MNPRQHLAAFLNFERDLKVEALVDDKRFNGADIFNFDRFLRIKLKNREILFKHDGNDQVEPAGDDADRNDAAQFAELLRFGHQVHIGDPDTDHNYRLFGQRFGIHDPGNFEDTLSSQFPDPVAHGPFGEPQTIRHRFERQPAVLQFLDDTDVDGIHCITPFVQFTYHFRTV